MNCPKCASEKKVKSGVVKGRQRYKCKECGCKNKINGKASIHEKTGASSLSGGIGLSFNWTILAGEPCNGLRVNKIIWTQRKVLRIE
jgi:hypothetical protein